MQELVKVIPFGGMNTDDNVTSVQPLYPSGDYLDSENTRLGSIDGFNNARISVKGNEEKVNPYLPEGINYSVGRFERRDNGSLFLFNWNSEEEHGIYEYQPASDTWYELVTGPALGFVKNWKICSVNLVNNELLYWTDARENQATLEIEGNGLRCVNIVKAKNRLRGWDLVFDKAQWLNPDLTTIAVTATLYDEAGVPVFIGLAYPTGATMTELMASLADGLNAVFTLVNFTSCGEYVEADMVVEGKYLLDISVVLYEGASAILGEALEIPNNFYPDTLRVEHIDRAKYSPLCHPRFTYTTDVDVKQNLVTKKWFQFAVQYEYDNNELSPISPVSELAYSNPLCGITTDLGSPNCIKIDFEDDRLNDISSLAVLKRVLLLVRYGSTDPNWRLVTTLERWEFGITENTFLFYNDSNYGVYSETEYRQNIPLKALGQEFVGSRGYISGTLEGEDNICIEAETEVTYADACDPEAFGAVYAKIKIRNPAQPTYSQAIHGTAGGTPYFGGMLGAGGFTNDPADVQQEIPLAGFLAYAVGTPYTAVSRQNKPGSVVTIPGEENVFNVSGANYTPAFTEVQNDTVYSELTLNLPPGRHIIRLASHQIGPDQTGLYKFPGTGYQKTSTYLKTFPSNANTVYSDVCEIIVDVAEGVTTDIGTIEVYDFTGYCLLHGYCLDSEGDNDADEVIAGAQVEMMAVTDPSTPTINGFANKGVTDPNGFFFLAKAGNITYNPTFTGNGLIFRTTGENFFSNSLNSLFNGDTAVTVTSYAPGSGTGKGVVVYNVHIPGLFSEYARTRVTGAVKNSSGSPIPGMTIICGLTGRITATDGDGEFSIMVYSNSLTLANRTAYLIQRPSGACCIDFIAPVPGEDYQIKLIAGIGTTYTYTNTIATLDFVTDIDGQAIDLLWKHRNRVELGIVYLDEAGRRSKVQDSDLFVAEIPAITDEGGNTGRPVVKWSINHQPPASAVKFMLVRKQNPYYSRLLQFIIGEVQYVSLYDNALDPPEPITTSYGAGDAKEIYLSLMPVINYGQENTGTAITFIPEPGDRLTFLRDDEGVVYSEYYDYEISSRGDGTPTSPTIITIKADPSLPEIFPGAFVELYTPKKAVEEDFFFEFGQCWDILEPGTANRRHAAGEDGADQVIGASPATGYLYRGDCFVRTRDMFYLEGIEKNYHILKCEDFYIYDNDNTSNQESIGHPNTADPAYKQFFHRARIRATDVFNVTGNKYFNGLSTFPYSLYKDGDQTWGAMHKLVRVGEKHELIAIQSNKLQPVYIGAIPIETLNSGDGRTAVSDQLINIFQPFKSPYGSQHPESIVQDGNTIWGFDLSRATFWVYNLNDPEPISDTRKIRKKVEEIVAYLEDQPLEYIHIWGGIDRRNKEVVWAFQEIPEVLPGPGFETGEAEAEETGIGTGETARTGDPEAEAFNPITISFSYKRGRWETRYLYFPDTISPVGENRFYSMKDGRLYLHDIGNAGNFYGMKTAASIRVVVAVAPNLVKDWYGGRIKSIGAWKMSDIQIPANNTFKTGMRSRLTTNNYTLAEGDYWFSFLQDMNDPAFDTELKALFNGRSLKGGVMIITFENNDTTQASLDEVAIKVSKSEETV